MDRLYLHKRQKLCILANQYGFGDVMFDLVNDISDKQVDMLYCLFEIYRNKLSEVQNG